MYQSIAGHLTFGLRSCDALDVKSVREKKNISNENIDGIIKTLILKASSFEY